MIVLPRWNDRSRGDQPKQDAAEAMAFHGQDRPTKVASFLWTLCLPGAPVPAVLGARFWGGASLVTDDVKSLVERSQQADIRTGEPKGKDLPDHWLQDQGTTGSREVLKRIRPKWAGGTVSRALSRSTSNGHVAFSAENSSKSFQGSARPRKAGRLWFTRTQFFMADFDHELLTATEGRHWQTLSFHLDFEQASAISMCSLPDIAKRDR